MDKFYLITFTPLGRFYFGSSNSWGESFYATSLKFPTQTTILGCLRRSMLKQNDLLDDSGRYPKKNDNGLIQSLTGKSKAKGLDETELDLGIIKKLSPVFVTQSNSNGDIENFLFPLPVDVYKKDECKLSIIEYKKVYGAKTSRNNSFAYKKITEGKTHSVEILGNIDAWDAYINSREIDYKKEYETDKIIIPTSQPGIARENRNKKEGDFYRKKDFMLAEGYRFGIIIDADEKLENKLNCGFVFLGGEQSKFWMDVAELTENLKTIFPQPFQKFFDSYNPGNKQFLSNAKKVVLMSHLLANKYPEGVDHFIINNMETIRSLNESGHKTYSFRAIPAGSVFYPNGNFSFQNNYKFASKIGYNFFIEVN